MDAINRLTTKVFDVLLTPLELLGTELALILISGLFGILALLVFKQISWQKGIKGVKDKIKGDMIAIRIYQDDLLVVGGSVVKIVARNFAYLSLNFLPILPLMAPFVLVLAQLVVRYGFDPIPVQDPAVAMLPGEGTMLEVQLTKGREADVAGMKIHLPTGLKAISPPVMNASDGVAFQEVIAIQEGEWEIEFEFADGVRSYKRIVTGEEGSRVMQPERVASFWSAWLWPAEDMFGDDSPLERVAFVYPERDLKLLPDGPFGIILVFLVASMAFGALILKPLGIQI
ncbi:MAG: hypothetical protein AAF682_03335 [Planctomycetota bacterium]